MKIAFFSDCYLDLTGGITSSINAQKAALEKAGHTVYIFSTSYPKSKTAKSQLAKENIFPVPSCRFLLRGITPISHRPHLIEKWLLQNHPEIKDFDIYPNDINNNNIGFNNLSKKMHKDTFISNKIN